MGIFRIGYESKNYDDEGSYLAPALMFVLDDDGNKSREFDTEKQARKWFKDNPQNDHLGGHLCLYHVVDLGNPIGTQTVEVVKIVELHEKAKEKA